MGLFSCFYALGHHVDRGWASNPHTWVCKVWRSKKNWHRFINHLDLKRRNPWQTEVLPLESCSFKVLADLAASPWKWLLYNETVATHFPPNSCNTHIPATYFDVVCAIAPVFASLLHRHLDCDPRSIHLARSFVCTTVGCKKQLCVRTLLAGAVFSHGALHCCRPSPHDPCKPMRSATVGEHTRPTVTTSSWTKQGANRPSLQCWYHTHVPGKRQLTVVGVDFDKAVPASIEKLSLWWWYVVICFYALVFVWSCSLVQVGISRIKVVDVFCCFLREASSLVTVSQKLVSTRVVTEAIPDLADDEKLFGGIGIWFQSVIEIYDVRQSRKPFLFTQNESLVVKGEQADVFWASVPRELPVVLSHV